MAGAGYWLWQRQQSPTQAPVEVLSTAQISRGELAFNVAASGNVALDARYGLTFRIPGTVTSVDVQVGDRVERGQRLATLDDRALRDALQQVRLDLAQAELNLEQLQQPSDEEQIRLAESAIQESRQAMAAAEASEAAAVARAQVNQARAIDLAETATEAYETTMDEIARAGLPD
jgi:multidrug efflux pump subunit AcrA (membrane-fusion protein)